MRRLTLLLTLLLFMTACSVAPTPQVPPSEVTEPVGGGDVPIEVTAPPPPAEPTPTNTPIPTPEPLPLPDVTRNYLLLGGDWRQHRVGTRYGDKTDLMILVRINDRDRMPAKIDMVQFPRNFFTPVENTDNMWLFHVYGLEGFPGLHYYFQTVFDVDLDGIFYVHLDNFVPLFDGLFPDGIEIPGTTRDAGLYTWTDGEAILKFLRDNDNNWGCPQYDCGDRQMRVLTQIGFTLKEQVKDDPLGTLMDLWDAYSKLIVTDLSTIDQVKEGALILSNLMNQDFQLNYWKLTEANGVEYGEGNLDVRGFGITDHSAMLEWLWTRLR